MKIGVPGGAKSPEGRHLHLAGEYSDLVIRPIVEKYGGIWRDDAPVVVDGNPDLVSAPQRYRALLERDSRLVSRTLTVSRRSRRYGVLGTWMASCALGKRDSRRPCYSPFHVPGD